MIKDLGQNLEQTVKALSKFISPYRPIIKKQVKGNILSVGEGSLS